MRHGFSKAPPTCFVSPLSQITQATLTNKLEQHVDRIDTDLVLEYQMAQGLGSGKDKEAIWLMPKTARHTHGPERHSVAAVVRLVTGFG